MFTGLASTLGRVSGSKSPLSGRKPLLARDHPHRWSSSSPLSGKHQHETPETCKMAEVLSELIRFFI